MSKIFCAGCKHRVYCKRDNGLAGFYYCDRLNTDSLLERKEFCGGKYWVEKTDKKTGKDYWKDWYWNRGGRDKVQYSRKVTQVLKK